MDEIIFTLTQDEVIAITTALAVAMDAYQEQTFVADGSSDIAIDIDNQLEKWRKVQFSIARQRILDARCKFNPTAKPIR